MSNDYRMQNITILFETFCSLCQPPTPFARSSSALLSPAQPTQTFAPSSLTSCLSSSLSLSHSCFLKQCLPRTSVNLCKNGSMHTLIEESGWVKQSRKLSKENRYPHVYPSNVQPLDGRRTETSCECWHQPKGRRGQSLCQPAGGSTPPTSAR